MRHETWCIGRAVSKKRMKSSFKLMPFKVNMLLFSHEFRPTKMQYLWKTVAKHSNLTTGSCTGLEFKASLEKSLNFIKLKMSLNCFGKRVEGPDKFGICLCATFNKNLATWWLWELPAIVASKLVEELLRPLIINKHHAWILQISVFFLKYQKGCML